MEDEAMDEERQDQRMLDENDISLDTRLVLRISDFVTTTPMLLS